MSSNHALSDAAWTAFDEVLDLLCKLNHERHEEEKRAGLTAPPPKEKKPKKKAK